MPTRGHTSPPILPPVLHYSPAARRTWCLFLRRPSIRTWLRSFFTTVGQEKSNMSRGRVTFERVKAISSRTQTGNQTDNTHRILYERERTRRRVVDYLVGALTRGAQLREESDNVAD